MPNVSIRIEVKGLDGMANDFGQLSTPEPFERAKVELDAALAAGFEGTQLAVPVGTGDYRRPAGALRDSGRMASEMDEDTWTGSVSYGTNTDVLPYAAWTRYKNMRKGKGDYLGDPMEAATPLFDRAVNAPWNEVFGDSDL